MTRFERFTAAEIRVLLEGLAEQLSDGPGSALWDEAEKEIVERALDDDAEAQDVFFNSTLPLRDEEGRI